MKRSGKTVGILAADGYENDMPNAGANWTDQAAFRRDSLVWGRVVEDIPDDCRELISALKG